MGSIAAPFPGRWPSCNRIQRWKSVPAQPPTRRVNLHMRSPASIPRQVYGTAEKMMAKMREYPGFLFVNSELYNHTPNLQVDIRREQAKLYGVSESRILTLLHDAYSQNYSYLIKKSTDQYQVILEVADSQRSAPEDLGRLYIKSDDGQRMVPLNAVTSWHPVIGPQA